MPGPIRPDGILQPARARPEAQPPQPAPMQGQGQLTPEMQQMLLALLALMGMGGASGGMAQDVASAPMGAAPMLPPGGLPNG